MNVEFNKWDRIKTEKRVKTIYVVTIELTGSEVAVLSDLALKTESEPMAILIDNILNSIQNAD